MKVVFLCRDSVAAIYVANVLAREGLIDAIVLERGTAARKRKLRRLLKKTPAWKLPIAALDVLALTAYAKLCTRYLIKHLLRPNGYSHYPTATDAVDDANDDRCIDILKSHEPDVLLVLGTSILKEPLLSLPCKHLLNIHGGIVPGYRNVHSDFWAFRNGDHQHVGTSILHLDRGIDSGDVALQDSLDIDAQDNIFTIKKKNLELSAQLAVQALRQAASGTLARETQNADDARSFGTPGCLDLVRLLANSQPAKRPDRSRTMTTTANL